jgi:ribosome-associated protein
MIQITPFLAIDEKEIEERFIRSPGPGGQNVNKVATAVQLRFDAGHSASLPPAVRERLAALAGRRLSRDGILTVTANRHRSQERNRAEALERLVELIREASVVPTIRRPTRVPRATKRRRVEAKTHRGAIKRLRKADAED